MSTLYTLYPSGTTADFLGVSGQGRTVYVTGTAGVVLALIRSAPGP